MGIIHDRDKILTSLDRLKPAGYPLKPGNPFANRPDRDLMAESHPYRGKKIAEVISSE